MIRLGATLGLCGLLWACATPPPPCPCPTQPPPAAAPAAPAPAAQERVALEPLMDSVVQIRVRVGGKVVAGQRQETYEYGTGFFVNERGRILTSAHVLGTIDDPRNLSVLHAGRTLQARILKVDRDTDLAVLLVDAAGCRPAS
jgi:S1-C subfamily serine protease